MVSTLFGLLLLTSVLLPTEAAPNAKPEVQDITPRASYLGGWSLALDGSSTCPAASSACDISTYSSLAAACCPSGQTCIVQTLKTYCCPSATDCGVSVTNFPVCADSSWTMYQISFGNFCCKNTDKGIVPKSGYGGLCVPKDQPVESSQLAKTVTQVGVTAPGATGGSSSGSSTTGSGSTPANPTGTAVGTGDGTNPTEKTTTKSSSSLSTGAIIGLAIGGVALLLLAGILWVLVKRYRAKKHQMNPVYMPAPPGPGPTTYPEAVQRKPVGQVNTTSMYSATSGGYAVSPPSSTPPQYSNLATNPAPNQYDPPTPNSPSPRPYPNYSEMDEQGTVNRAELRGSN